MTSMEGRSLLRGGVLLAVLAVCRLGVDSLRSGESIPLSNTSDLSGLIAESDSVREDQARRSSPLGPDERLDPNRSEEWELDRLPGIGPATARALIQDREENGGFAEPEDLLRVPGIGPAKLERIRSRLDFSKGMPLELRRRPSGGEIGSDRARRPETPDRVSSFDAQPPARARVDLNRASAEELQSLPGIGPALAERILASRRAEGPFRTPEDLLRIRGIGPATLDRLRGLILPAG